MCDSRRVGENEDLSQNSPPRTATLGVSFWFFIYHAPRRGVKNQMTHSAWQEDGPRAGEGLSLQRVARSRIRPHSLRGRGLLEDQSKPRLPLRFR